MSSPLSQIESTSSCILCHISADWMRPYRPLFSNTVGPSKSSQGTTAQALPGRSIFIWVPTARKSPIACIEAGWTPAAASPDVRGRPYRRRNPPGVLGSPKTGRPAIISRMKRSSVLILRRFVAVVEGSFFFRDAKVEMKSHPGICNLSVCF